MDEHPECCCPQCCDCWPEVEKPRTGITHTHPIGGGKSLTTKEAIAVLGLGWKVKVIDMTHDDPGDLSGLPVRTDADSE